MYDRPVSTENASRTIAVAIALWGGAVTAATFSGALTKFSLAELATPLAFGFVFATAIYYLDKPVRAVVDAIDLRVLALLAAVADLAIAAAVGFAFLPASIFALPLAGVAHVILVDRLIRTRSSSTDKRVRGAGMPSAAA